MGEVALDKVEPVGHSGESGVGPVAGPAGGGGKYDIVGIVSGKLPELTVPVRIPDHGRATVHHEKHTEQRKRHFVLSR